MQTRLKYPIFTFTPKDDMFYVFWEDNKVTTLDLLNKCNGWKGDVVIDFTGTKYTIKRSYMTGWKGIHGFTGVRKGMISFEREYEDNPTPITLRDLQERIAERYPRTQAYRSCCWDSVEDFRQAVFSCRTFEELALLFERPPETFRTRLYKILHPTRRQIKDGIITMMICAAICVICYFIFGV